MRAARVSLAKHLALQNYKKKSSATVKNDKLTPRVTLTRDFDFCLWVLNNA